MTELPMDFGQFLLWIATPGVLGMIIAMLLAQLDSFNLGLSAEAKRLVVFAISLAIPIIGRLVTELPPNIYATLADWWPVIAAGLVVWGGSQVTHKVQKLLEFRVEDEEE